jgi:hypothetical protein
MAARAAAALAYDAMQLNVILSGRVGGGTSQIYKPEKTSGNVQQI